MKEENTKLLDDKKIEPIFCKYCRFCVFHPSGPENVTCQSNTPEFIDPVHGPSFRHVFCRDKNKNMDCKEFTKIINEPVLKEKCNSKHWLVNIAENFIALVFYSVGSFLVLLFIYLFIKAN